ncbi:MAG: rRNA pseudouridine synthase [Chitinophagales bacterium]|nr:rRNA pseudouridine synthase [Chitinophagales bacterium]
MSESNIIRLNKYLAHSGVASRRKADELIRNGQVKVNNEVVIDPAYEVQRGDKIFFKGKPVKRERHVYILLNKPRDCISTTDDERGRKTVLDVIKPKLDKLMRGKDIRLYPVGRLDRNTTGLILVTNDGQLAQKLSHPSSNIQKTYQVELNRGLSEDDKTAISKGLNLEDGLASIDEIAFPEESNRKIVGLTLHSGKNRIVRRIFEHLNYDVKKLDRVLYAGLSKKNLPKGKWRFLGDKEVGYLKKL